MTGAEAAATWLGWFAQERRASAHSIEAYGRDVAQFLGFLTGHLGAEPDLATLGTLRLTDLRAFLSARAMEGDVGATRARKLAAVRSFLRYLQRHQGMASRKRAPLPKKSPMSMRWGGMNTRACKPHVTAPCSRCFMARG